jgi:hypothetical protein
MVKLWGLGAVAVFLATMTIAPDQAKAQEVGILTLNMNVDVETPEERAERDRRSEEARREREQREAEAAREAAEREREVEAEAARWAEQRAAEAARFVEMRREAESAAEGNLNQFLAECAALRAAGGGGCAIPA